jgi:hypothetical protein
MADSVQIVLNAFEALFNKRDYAAAERFWSPNYSLETPPVACSLCSSVPRRAMQRDRQQ